MKFVFTLIITVLAVFCVSQTSLSQEESPSSKKLFKKATECIYNGDMQNGLPLLLEYDSAENGNSAYVKYLIGVCYLKSKYEKARAIPYLKESVRKEGFVAESVVFVYLGDLYHLQYDFEEAIKNYKNYLKMEDRFGDQTTYCKQMIAICQNALLLKQDSVYYKIEKADPMINSVHSEKNPLISIDGKVLYYTYQMNPDVQEESRTYDSLSHIYFSQLDGAIWTKPQEVLASLAKEQNIFLAGLSPDGEYLFINKAGDLYFWNRSFAENENLSSLGKSINSEFFEGSANISPDGNELYFSSNRPGGYGGFDLYKCTLLETEQWSEAVNLGNTLNTEKDEDAPFIHADNQHLFFSSKGHNTIGGYDIFTSEIDSTGKWSTPENIGMPVNTVKDDLYFMLTANGKNGFFSSSRDDKFNCHDIYKIDMRKSINLTMLSGTITAGEPAKPIAAKIKVIDKETGERVKYTYNPNPKTGKYMLIFPPGKNYDIIVEAEGFLPQLLNVYFPEQEYFYELHQEIHLTSINAMGEKIGERITVTSTFQDIYKTDNTTTSDQAEKNYKNLFSMVEDMIGITDSITENNEDIELFFASVTKTDDNSTDANTDYSKLFQDIDEIINSNSNQREQITGNKEDILGNTVSQTYYYSEDGNDALIPVIIDGDTLFTTPGLSIANKDPLDPYSTISMKESIDNEPIEFVNVKENYKRRIFSFDVKFEPNSSKITGKSMEVIDSLLEFASNNPKLGIDLLGFCDEPITNLSISSSCLNLGNKRSAKLNETLTRKGLLKSRINTLKINEAQNLSTDHKSCVTVSFYELSETRLFEINANALIDFNIDSIKVEDIKAGQEIRLNNIFFEYNSSTLTTKSTTELLEVITFLNENPLITIEIGGHTDNVGLPSGNLKLSLARAQSVADFFIRNGISSSRLMVKGYGQTKPIADNNTAQGKELNRRVVFIILDK